MGLGRHLNEFLSFILVVILFIKSIQSSPSMDTSSLSTDRKPAEDLAALIQGSNILTSIRLGEEHVEEWLNLDQQKADFKDKLKAAAEKTGELPQLKPEHFDKAADQFFRERYFSVEAQPKDTWYKLLELYANRLKIWHQVGKPMLTVVGALGVVGLGLMGFSSLKERHAMRNVARQTETAYLHHASLAQDIEVLREKAEQKGIVGLEQSLRNAELSLQQVSPFFAAFCTDGTANEVTRSNYREVQQQLLEASGRIEKADQSMSGVRNELVTLDNLLNIRESLGTVYNEIGSLARSPQVSAKAEGLYKSGMISIDGKETKSAEQYLQEMQQLRLDAKALATLPGEIEQSYKRIQSIVKDPAEREKADQAYATALQLVPLLDVKALNRSLQGFNEQFGMLNNEYEVRVKQNYSYQGETYALFWRDFEGADGSHSGKRYFAIVEAVSTQGVVPVRINDTISKRVDTVTFWAEEIPQSVYDELAKDKRKDGTIDNDLIAIKSRGYRNPVMQMREYGGRAIQAGHRLMNWEEGAEMVR